MHVPTLAYPRQFQTVGDVDGCQHLWINQGVDTEFLEKDLVLGREIFIVVNTGYCLLRAKSMGQDACIQVSTLLRRNAYEEVCLISTCFLQSLDTGR